MTRHSSVGPFPNRTGQFPGILLSSDHGRMGPAVRLAWMASWYWRQSTRVLRLRLATRRIQAGFLRRPGRLVEVNFACGPDIHPVLLRGGRPLKQRWG